MGNLKFYNLQLAAFTNIPNPGFLMYFQYLALSKSLQEPKDVTL